MIELNDSNANYSQNGLSIFVNRIDVDDDIFISSSCVFLSDIVTAGKIHAQYNLAVQGFLSAEGDIDIGGELQCIRLKGKDTSIGGRLAVKDDVTCSNLFVAGDVIVGSAFCTNIEVQGTLVSTGMVDSAENIKVSKSLVSLDFVQASGRVMAAEAIAVDVSASEEHIGRKVLMSTDTVELQSCASTPQSIANSDISEIFDAHSPLAIVIDDCAVFLDHFNEKLCVMPPTDEKLRSYIATFADFFPDYSALLQVIDLISFELSRDTIDDDVWVDDFNNCVAAQVKLPSWYVKSQVAKAINEKILGLLAYQSMHDLSIKSFSTWIITNHHAQILRDIYSDDPRVLSQLDHLNERLIRSIGLKVPFLNLLFTQK